MKITFVLPFASLSGGVRVVATYARYLHERGHEITVVSQPFQPQIGIKGRFKALVGLGKGTTDWPSTPLLDFLGTKHKVLEKERPLIAEDLPDADIVVATWWETAEWVSRLPVIKGQKFYLIQGYETFSYLPVDRVIATYHMDLRKIAVSNYIRKEIETRHGVSGIEIINNAVDLEQFKTKFREKNNNLTLGFLYTDTPCKNVRLAIDVATTVKERLPTLKVIAFGVNPQFDHLPLPDWIQFHQSPDQAEISNLYSQCDLWLFTSETEGFGLPILEAMACRTPVLGTRAGAAPELINGRNGTLLRGDVEVFAKEILRFETMSPDEWRNYSKAALQTAKANSWDIATDRLLEAFEAAQSDYPPQNGSR